MQPLASRGHQLPHRRDAIRLLGRLPGVGLIRTSLSRVCRPNLVVGVSSLGTKLDPANAPLSAELRISGSIFDTLIRRDFRAEARDPSRGVVLTPCLATNWHRVDDRTVELNLRRGVRFHNGDEFTAEDVAFTFSPERIFSPNALLPGARSYLGCLNPVRVIDPYRVHVQSCNIDPALELKLAYYAASIVNKRAYLSLGVSGFGRAPVGTGPARFVRWRDGEYVELAAHDRYFEGRPNFSTITFAEVPESSTRVAGLVGGDFDIIAQIGPDQFPLLSAHRDLGVRLALREHMLVLWIAGDRPGVSDRRVRRALGLAINREQIVAALWQNMTSVATDFQIPVLNPNHIRQDPNTGYDPAEARALLTEAGYRGDRILLRAVSNYYVDSEQVALIVQEMWRAVGVNASVEFVESFSRAFDKGGGAVLGACGFDYPAPEALNRYFVGEDAYMRQHGFSHGIGDLDSIASGLATFNRTRREEVFEQMLAVISSEVPIIPMYRVPQFYAARHVVRWQPSADLGMDFRPISLSFATP